MEILYFPYSEKLFLVFSVIRKVIFFVFRRPKICFLVFRSERGCTGRGGGDGPDQAGWPRWGAGPILPIFYFRRTSARITCDGAPLGAAIQIPMLILTWSSIFIGLPSCFRPESIGTQATDRPTPEHPCKLMELNENLWNSRKIN